MAGRHTSTIVLVGRLDGSIPVSWLYSPKLSAPKYIESSAAVSPKRGRKSNNFLLRAVAFVHTKKLQTAILTPLDVKNNGNVLTVIGGSKLILSFVYLLPPKINAVNR